jgi:hypothetical protein
MEDGGEKVCGRAGQGSVHCALPVPSPSLHTMQCDVLKREGRGRGREGRMEAWDGSLVVYSVLRSVALHAFQQRDLGPRSLARFRSLCGALG